MIMESMVVAGPQCLPVVAPWRMVLVILEGSMVGVTRTVEAILVGLQGCMVVAVGGIERLSRH
ncbi:hypothetical protein [Endozoicomonas sp. SESOKO1]|uniref:hypothetical protein n=1 Tax=Endozoicomonas sp. SESOKO1 TaxID=2828742 RepID=UPI0021474B05|nr:hypothetical protein [Endozoicomonas sp. SESOKO1]